MDICIFYCFQNAANEKLKEEQIWKLYYFSRKSRLDKRCKDTNYVSNQSICVSINCTQRKRLDSEIYWCWYAILWSAIFVHGKLYVLYSVLKLHKYVCFIILLQYSRKCFVQDSFAVYSQKNVGKLTIGQKIRNSTVLEWKVPLLQSINRFF